MAHPASRPSRWSPLWRWLRYGRRGGSAGWTIYHSGSHPRWWSVPALTWRVLARRRGVTPTPMFYLVLGGVGLLLGVLLQLALGVWWWMPPAVLLAAAWLVVFTSIWWHHPHGHPTSLRTELLQVFSPKKGALARRREDQQRIRSAGLPLFEVQDWPGPVSLDGWGSSGANVSHISLAFRDTAESPPVVTVGTVIGDSTRAAGVRAHLRGELTGLLIRDKAATALGPDAIRDVHRRITERLLALAWTPSTVRVDGTDLEAWRLVVDGCSASCAVLDGVWVTITASGVGEFSLRTVTAPGRFLDLP